MRERKARLVRAYIRAMDEGNRVRTAAIRSAYWRLLDQR